MTVKPRFPFPMRTLPSRAMQHDLSRRGGGTIQTGRHLRVPKETPIANLWQSLLERMDVRAPFVGDSTGALTGLA